MPEFDLTVDAGPPGLEDPDRLRAADVTGAVLHAAMSGAQLRSAAGAAASGVLESIRGLRPRTVVWVCGRARAAHDAAELVAALAARARSGSPVVRATGLPAWVGALEVVVVSGDDPGDPVTAAAVYEALRRGAQVVLDVPDVGPVADAAAGRAPAIPVSPHLPAHRGAFARHVGAGAAVLTALGVRGLDPDALADAVDTEVSGLGPEIATAVNPAKLLAGTVAGVDPLVWVYDDAVAGALARRAVTAFAAAGRTTSALPVPDAVRSVTDRALSRPAARPDPAADLFHDPLLDDPLPARVRHLGVDCSARPEPVRHATAALEPVEWVTDVRPAGGAGGSAGTEPYVTAAEVVAFAARVELAAAYLLVGGA